MLCVGQRLVVSAIVRACAALLACAALSGCGAVESDAPAIRVMDSSFGMDCMPVYPPDSSVASITVDYTNDSPAARRWVIEVGWVELSVPERSGTLRFPMRPADSGVVLPGQSVRVTHTKAVNTGEGTTTCGFCDWERGRWQMFVRWSAGGETLELPVGSGPAGCTS